MGFISSNDRVIAALSGASSGMLRFNHFSLIRDVANVDVWLIKNISSVNPSMGTCNYIE